MRFQSTLPVRGATTRDASGNDIIKISIHAPREGSDLLGFDRTGEQLHISIHAPREGSDRSIESGSSVRDISIHAPREGSDV